jgi:hypothetical protein
MDKRRQHKGINCFSVSRVNEVLLPSKHFVPTGFCKPPLELTESCPFSSWLKHSRTGVSISVYMTTASRMRAPLPSSTYMPQ